MPRLVLFLFALLSAHCGWTQISQSFSGFLTTTSPVTQQMLQGVSPFVNPTCTVAKPFPGLVPANLLPYPFRYTYATHTITNFTTTPNCLHLTLTVGCVEPTAFLLLSVYSGSFDPINLATNYKSDGIAYYGRTSRGVFSVAFAPGETLVLVVSAVDADVPCSGYTVAAYGTPLPTLAMTPAAARPALQAYPNPASTQLTLSGPLGTPYQLLNQFGQVVRAGQVTAQPLDVQALPAGLYLLRDDTTGRTSKLVKE